MPDGAEFSALEIANLYRMSRSTIYRWIKARKLAASKNPAGRWVITLPLPTIQAAAPEVVPITRTVEAPAKSLWAYRRELHGF